MKIGNAVKFVKPFLVTREFTVTTMVDELNHITGFVVYLPLQQKVIPFNVVKQNVLQAWRKVETLIYNI